MKVIGYDNQGRLKLSKKEASPPPVSATHKEDRPGRSHRRRGANH